MKWALLFSLLLLAACRSSGLNSASPYTPVVDAARDTARAEKLTREAADLVATDPAKAEAILREALGADLFHGPAHNNLGVVYLGQSKLYEAASEFEWARKLMPGHPDPRLNLALTLERAGRTDDALGAYGAALEAQPEYVAAIQGMARLMLRSSREDPRIDAWLTTIALKGSSPHWREWAQARLAAR